MEKTLVNVPVYRALLDEIFPTSYPNHNELWERIENGEVFVYKMDGAWFAVSLTRLSVCIECLEKDGTGIKVMDRATIALLRRFVLACNRTVCIVYVEHLKKYLVTRHGFIPVGTRGTDTKLMKVFKWVNPNQNNPPIRTQQQPTQQTMQQR